MAKAARPPVQELAIVPFVSVGPLRFGMNRQQVKARWGEPELEEDDDIMEELRLSWPGVVCRFEPRVLKSVALARPVRAMVSGVDIFAQKDVIGALSKIDPRADDAGAYANFPKLGICLGGFGRRRIPEGKIVYAYDKSKREFFAQMIRV